MSGFRFDATSLLTGLAAYESKTLAATRMFAETAAKDFESYAKRNRPWTDRTSRARQGLTGFVTQTKTGWRINIAQTVDYGIWLELANEKKYAILEPTVRLKGPEVIKAFKKNF